MSGSGPTSTSTTTNPYQEDWRRLIDQSGALTANPFPVYNGPTVAPLSQNQTTAIDMANQFATNGTPAGSAANNAIVRQANGTVNPYLGQNPFMEQVINPSNKMITDAYGRGVAAQTDAAAARAGSFGGSGYQEQVGVNERNLADALAANTSGLLSQNFYNNANLWNTDQARQLAAAQLGPGSQASDMAAIDELLKTGAVSSGNTQAVMDAMQKQFGDWITSQFLPLQTQANILGQAQGNTTTTYQGPGTNPWLSAGGLLGYFLSQ